MEKFNVISNAGSEVQLPDRQEYVTQATKVINRQVFRMHTRHIVSWLLRGAVILCLLYLGRHVIDGVIGETLTWTVGFLLVCLLFYISKGHRGVQRFREAKMYWLLDDAAHTDFISDDLVEDSPGQVQESMQPQDKPNPKGWFQEHALS